MSDNPVFGAFISLCRTLSRYLPLMGFYESLLRCDPSGFCRCEPHDPGANYSNIADPESDWSDRHRKSPLLRKIHPELFSVPFPPSNLGAVSEA